MNNLNPSQKKKLIILLTLIGLVVLIILGILFLPLLNINNSVVNFYKTASGDNFVSNYDIVGDKNFSNKIEIETHKFDLFNPVIVTYYKADKYKNLEHAVIADFLYLKRTNLVSWSVVKYESSYEPYYANQGMSIADLYNSLKSDVHNGRITHGVSPQDEKKLNVSKGIAKPGDIINTVKSPDNKQSIVIQATDNYGENKLLLGQQDLGIKDVNQAIWSSDSSHIIYSTGKYNQILGELDPNADIWITDLSGNKAKLLNNQNNPNDISLYATGTVIVYGTKNLIGIMNIDGTNNKIILQYNQPVSNTEAFILPQVKSVDSQYIYLLVPDVDFIQNNKLIEYKISLTTGLVIPM